MVHVVLGPAVVSASIQLPDATATSTAVHHAQHQDIAGKKYTYPHGGLSPSKFGQRGSSPSPRKGRNQMGASATENLKQRLRNRSPTRADSIEAQVNSTIDGGISVTDGGGSIEADVEIQGASVGMKISHKGSAKAELSVGSRQGSPSHGLGTGWRGRVAESHRMVSETPTVHPSATGQSVSPNKLSIEARGASGSSGVDMYKQYVQRARSEGCAPLPTAELTQKGPTYPSHRPPSSASTIDTLKQRLMSTQDSAQSSKWRSDQKAAKLLLHQKDEELKSSQAELRAMSEASASVAEALMVRDPLFEQQYKQVMEAKLTALRAQSSGDASAIKKANRDMQDAQSRLETGANGPTGSIEFADAEVSHQEVKDLEMPVFGAERAALPGWVELGERVYHKKRGEGTIVLIDQSTKRSITVCYDSGEKATYSAESITKLMHMSRQNALEKAIDESYEPTRDYSSECNRAAACAVGLADAELSGQGFRSPSIEGESRSVSPFWSVVKSSDEAYKDGEAYKAAVELGIIETEEPLKGDWEATHLRRALGSQQSSQHLSSTVHIRDINQSQSGEGSAGEGSTVDAVFQAPQLGQALAEVSGAFAFILDNVYGVVNRVRKSTEQRQPVNESLAGLEQAIEEARASEAQFWSDRQYDEATVMQRTMIQLRFTLKQVMNAEAEDDDHLLATKLSPSAQSPTISTGANFKSVLCALDADLDQVMNSLDKDLLDARQLALTARSRSTASGQQVSNTMAARSKQVNTALWSVHDCADEAYKADDAYKAAVKLGLIDATSAHATVDNHTADKSSLLNLAEELLQGIDTNNDGVVDQGEFLAAGGTQQEFAKYDLDGDGVLDAAELQQVIRDPGARVGRGLAWRSRISRAQKQVAEQERVLDPQFDQKIDGFTRAHTERTVRIASRWQVVEDNDFGVQTYYNTETGTHSWEKPADFDDSTVKQASSVMTSQGVHDRSDDGRFQRKLAKMTASMLQQGEIAPWEMTTEQHEIAPDHQQRRLPCHDSRTLAFINSAGDLMEFSVSDQRLKLCVNGKFKHSSLTKLEWLQYDEPSRTLTDPFSFGATNSGSTLPADVDVAHLKALADQCGCQWRGDVPDERLPAGRRVLLSKSLKQDKFGLMLSRDSTGQIRVKKLQPEGLALKSGQVHEGDQVSIL